MIHRQKILFVQQELTDWNAARMWGYTAHIGLEEGLEACEVEFTTILSSWFPFIKEFYAESTFDQVWINDVIHMFEPKGWRYYRLTLDDLDWLASLAPVRLGFVIESLNYTEDDYIRAPYLANYIRILQKTIPYLTHILTPDEKDIDTIASMGSVHVDWYVMSIPLRYIFGGTPTPTGTKPVFRGTAYGDRGRWLSYPTLADQIDFQLSSDNDTVLPDIFDKLHKDLYPQAILNKEKLQLLYEIYLDIVRKARLLSFSMYMRDLQNGAAVINLPAWGKIYTGRVFEGLASGRPVVTYRFDNSPRMTSLFKDQSEIILYDGTDPESLALHLKAISDNPEFAASVAAMGLRTMRSYHSTEHRICQIIRWISDGKQIDYRVPIDEGLLRFKSVILPTCDEIVELYTRFVTEYSEQMLFRSALRRQLFLTGRSFGVSVQQLRTVVWEVIKTLKGSSE